MTDWKKQISNGVQSLFSKKNNVSSKEMLKKRLKVTLQCDKGMSPESIQMEKLREEIIPLLEKYFVIQRELIDIRIEKNASGLVILSSCPVDGPNNDNLYS